MPLRRILPLLLSLAPCVAAAQQPLGISIPSPADSTRDRIAGEITLPQGFEWSLFAAPPHLTYPVVVAPAGDGVVFVGTDPNLNFGRDRGRGRVLRFVDDDRDGRADRYTVFADSLDSVRGLVYDGGTLYVMHSPTLSALSDEDGDGRADRERVLVHGLGFTLDDRGGDHTSNLMRLGIDGWLYLAFGDYGFQDAVGSDGTHLRLHRGGVLRVRPDGSEMEVVARGTRNIYDFALDPYLRIFARDNTNNGQAWNSRLHYLPSGADAGYPSLFRNFPEEIHPALADFGAGAATAALWIQDPAWPAPYSSALLTADWALNRVYQHGLTPRGATFAADQQEFMSVPHASDMELDDASNLYVASLSGGSYTYAGEHVGYVVRVRPKGLSRGSAPEPRELDAAGLVERVLSGSAPQRLRAQRELLRRGSGGDAVRLLEDGLSSASAPVEGRIAALFTLKQLQGPASHEALIRAAGDPELRAMALRALADRRGELAGLPAERFERHLRDPDPFVRLQAATALGRLGTPEGDRALLEAAVDADPVVAHVARQALVARSAVGPTLAALDSGNPARREAALYVLSRLHTPEVVAALSERVQRTREQEARADLLQALARLYHEEGPWDGAWWGNQPDTEGPYFSPVPWAESEHIRPRLIDGLLGARGAPRLELASTLEREGVLPRQSAALLGRVAEESGEGKRLDDLVRALVGGRELRPEALELLKRELAGGSGTRVEVAGVLSALPQPGARAANLLNAIAVDRSLPPDARAQALTALGRATDPEAMDAAVAAHAAVVAELPRAEALLAPWRRFTSGRRELDALERFARLVREGDEGERVLGWAALVQAAAVPRNPAAVRTRATSLIDAAWSDPSSAAPLARAIRLLGAEERYAKELQGR